MSFGSPGSAYIALTDLPTTTQQANAISEEVKYTHKRPPAIHPARWWTLEFFIYYALLAFSVITGVRSAIQFSSGIYKAWIIFILVRESPELWRVCVQVECWLAFRPAN